MRDSEIPKEALSSKIAKDVEQYLADGGVINTVTSKQNAFYKPPKKLSWKKWVKMQKRRNHEQISTASSKRK